MNYDFGCSGGGLVILSLNCPLGRALIMHAEVYCSFDSFPISFMLIF
jgi:hypothetical protein